MAIAMVNELSLNISDQTKASHMHGCTVKIYCSYTATKEKNIVHGFLVIILLAIRCCGHTILRIIPSLLIGTGKH